MKLKKLIAATIATAMAFSVAPVTVPNQAKAATATTDIIRIYIRITTGSAAGKTVCKRDKRSKNQLY